jgi:hypothetical protein
MLFMKACEFGSGAAGLATEIIETKANVLSTRGSAEP